MQLDVEQKHQAEAHDLLRLAQWHLEVELDVVQEAVSVDVLLPAGDQRYPDILQQEVVDGLRSGPAQLLPLAGSGQEDQLVSEVDLGLLLVGGEPHPKSLGPDDTTTHNFRLICNVSELESALPVRNQERWNEGEKSDDNVEHCGPGDQRGRVDSDYRSAPHLVPYNNNMLHNHGWGTEALPHL